MAAKCELTFTFLLFLIKQRKPIHTGYQVSLNPPLRIMASAMQEDMDVSSHKGKKLRSFPLSFKLKVIEEVEMCGIVQLQENMMLIKIRVAGKESVHFKPPLDKTRTTTQTCRWCGKKTATPDCWSCGPGLHLKSARKRFTCIKKVDHEEIPDCVWWD